MKAVLYIIIGIAIGIIAGAIPRGQPDSCRAVVYDTVVYMDTVRVDPVVRDSVVIRYIEERLPVATGDTDTINAGLYVMDSVTVKMPVVQKVYSNDLYRAYISGYRPSLDSLYIYSPGREVMIRGKPKRWGIGPYVGVDASGRGVSVGVSLHYSLVRF